MAIGLTTDRLILNPATQDHLQSLHQLWTEAEVRRYLWDDEIISLERATDTLNESIDAADAEGLGMWALYRKSDPYTLIGFAALRHATKSREVEILYGLTPSCWGQGFATEASRALLKYAFEVLRLPRVVAYGDADNTKSFDVMRRLGMASGGDGAYFTIDTDSFLRNC